jgi:hypothetical protein
MKQVSEVAKVRNCYECPMYDPGWEARGVSTEPECRHPEREAVIVAMKQQLPNDCPLLDRALLIVGVR